MRGDLPLRRHAYTDRQRYIVYALWLHGATQTAIATVVGLRKKQVAGIVDRSEYGNRAALTMGQRDAYLRELAEIRRGDDGKTIDGGILPAAVFKARPLTRSR